MGAHRSEVALRASSEDDEQHDKDDERCDADAHPQHGRNLPWLCNRCLTGNESLEEIYRCGPDRRKTRVRQLPKRCEVETDEVFF
jgi:hypothetical protein